MVVVFPAPLRPSSPVIVPRWTVNETPSTARTVPNVFTTSRTDNTTDIRKLPGEQPAYCKRVGVQGFGKDGSSKGFGIRILRMLLTIWPSRPKNPSCGVSRLGAADAAPAVTPTKSTAVAILAFAAVDIHPPSSSIELVLNWRAPLS